MTVAVAAAGISSFALLYAPQPVLPQLAAQFRLDPGGASLAVSVATGALAISVLPIAALSEVIGRRPIILTSVIVSVVLGLLLPLAPSYPALLVLRALQGIAIAGFPGVAAAYLAERLGAAGVAAAVGAMIAGNTVGGMLGRLSAGFTADWLGWHGALAVVAGLSLVFSLVTVATLPPAPRQEGTFAPAERERGTFTTEKREQRSLPKKSAARNVLRGLGLAIRRPVLLAQYAVALLAMGSFVALYNAAGFRLTGELGLAPAVASLVFLAYAMGAVSSATAGRLIGRFGRPRALVGGLAVTIGGAALTIPDSLPLVVLGFVVLTGGFFAAHAVANGWAAAEAPARARGQVAGLYTLAYYLGSSLGGTIGSFVYGHAGWNWLIGATAVWLALAASSVFLTRRT
ncbi:MFS transporter [Amycolatopsis anabasis]|uniref:MFS transporter n=1 Tax=Amycolatopsis anabasis TaxID=1840409 RepID=UPI0015D34FAA|nr:MFS transporter [Amycolatopsis anabasis]